MLMNYIPILYLELVLKTYALLPMSTPANFNDPISIFASKFYKLWELTQCLRSIGCSMDI